METTNNTETHNHNFTNDDDCRRCVDCGKRESA
jgi:hypothetical protein